MTQRSDFVGMHFHRGKPMTEFFELFLRGADDCEANSDDDMSDASEREDYEYSATCQTSPPPTIEGGPHGHHAHLQGNSTNVQKRSRAATQDAEDIWRLYGGRQATYQRAKTLREMCRDDDEYRACASVERKEWLAWRELLQEGPYPPLSLPTREEVKKRAKTEVRQAFAVAPLPLQIPSLKATLSRKRAGW